jgi:hypothetical protein
MAFLGLGVTKVGLVASTKVDPVSSVTAAARQELGVAKKVASPVPKEVMLSVQKIH